MKARCLESWGRKGFTGIRRWLMSPGPHAIPPGGVAVFWGALGPSDLATPEEQSLVTLQALGTLDAPRQLLAPERWLRSVFCGAG